MSFCCCVSARSFLNKCESCRYAYRIRCAQIHIVVLILINSWRVCAPSGHLPIYTFPSRSHDRKMNKFRILNKLIAPTTCACRSKWENGAYCCIAAVWRECHKMWAHLIRCHYDVNVFVLRRCNMEIQCNHRHHHHHHEQWQHVDFSIYPLCGIWLTKRLESATNNGNKFIETSPFSSVRVSFELSNTVSLLVVATNLDIHAPFKQVIHTFK